jgi:hypothetical protein
MNLNAFAKLVAEIEGGKKQVNIAQIKEILKVVNTITRGILYAVVKTIK